MKRKNNIFFCLETVRISNGFKYSCGKYKKTTNQNASSNHKALGVSSIEVAFEIRVSCI